MIPNRSPYSFLSSFVRQPENTPVPDPPVHEDFETVDYFTPYSPRQADWFPIPRPSKHLKIRIESSKLVDSVEEDELKKDAKSWFGPHGPLHGPLPGQVRLWKPFTGGPLQGGT